LFADEYIGLLKLELKQCQWWWCYQVGQLIRVP